MLLERIKRRVDKKLRKGQAGFRRDRAGGGGGGGGGGSNLMLLCRFMSSVVKIRELPTPERKLISQVTSVCKLILVNPATRLKTWFRSTMTQERFTN